MHENNELEVEKIKNDLTEFSLKVYPPLIEKFQKKIIFKKIGE